MSDQRLTDLSELTTVADNDLIYVVDVSDTTHSAAGSSRYAQAKNARGYPQTSAESSAGVTPTNYEYEPGNVLRYGTNTTPGTTDMYAAFNAANSLTGVRRIVPDGTHLIGTNITLTGNWSMQGGTVKPNTGITVTLGAAANVASNAEWRDTALGSFAYTDGSQGRFWGEPAQDSFILNEPSNSVDTSAVGALNLGTGTNNLPCHIGKASGLPNGADLNPGWSADSSYVSGAADWASVLGGYDTIVNSEGSGVSQSNHSMISYGVGGHNYIAGGSYNWIAGDASRSSILGSRQCAIKDGDFNAVISTDDSDCAVGCGDHNVILGGKLNAMESGAYRSVILGGQSNQVATVSQTIGSVIVGGASNDTNHNYAVMIGRDGKSYVEGALHTGRDQLTNLADSMAIGPVVQNKKTTDNTLQNMSSFVDFDQVNNVVAGTGSVKVVGLLDGSADGNNDGIYTQVAYADDFGFYWDGTNAFLFKSGTETSVTTAPTLDLTLISQLNNDFTPGAAPHIALNSGSLRIKVTGIAGTTIKWVARIDLVLTQAG